MSKNILFFLLVFTLGCTKEELRVEPAVNQPLFVQGSQQEYDAMLNTLAIGLLEPSRESTFRSLVIERAREQFDGDDNVLLKTLSNEMNKDLSGLILGSLNKHKDYLAKMENSKLYDFGNFINLTEINEAIYGFGLPEQKWYTQIYIPFMDEVDLSQIPTVVVVNQDGGDCTFLAYEPISGTDEYRAVQVDEAYAKNRLTWVVSVNETVNNQGELPSVLENSSQVISTRSSGPELFVRVNQVRVTSKKECWACGRAEVRISYSIIDTPSSPFAQNCSNTIWEYGTSGTQIAHLRQRDLHEWQTARKGIATISNGVTYRLDPNETYVFTMFEYDSGGSLNELIFNPCYHSYYFRSNDSEYVAWGPGDSVGYSDFGSPNSTFQTMEKMNSGGNGVRFEYRFD